MYTYNVYDVEYKSEDDENYNAVVAAESEQKLLTHLYLLNNDIDATGVYEKPVININLKYVTDEELKIPKLLYEASFWVTDNF